MTRSAVSSEGAALGSLVPTAEEALDPARALVLSLKPRFAEAILSGTKTVEVRRVMPRITVPTLALLYAYRSE